MRPLDEHMDGMECSPRSPALSSLPDIMSFEDKPVVVTGASSGMGRSVAELLARRGAKVLAVGRDATKLEALQDAAGPRVVPFAVDLTDDGAPAAIVAAAESQLGGLRVLVHAAGSFDPLPLGDSDAATLDSQWAINVRAPYLLTRAALPALQQGGSIIFFSSLSALVGFPDSAAYAATKGAVEIMAKSLAVELGPQGIRVNAVAPGWIQTPMNEHVLADDAFREFTVGCVPLQRLGTPDDVAPVVAALGSDEFGYVTGATIRITGGYPTQRFG